MIDNTSRMINNIENLHTFLINENYYEYDILNLYNRFILQTGAVIKDIDEAKVIISLIKTAKTLTREELIELKF